MRHGRAAAKAAGRESLVSMTVQTTIPRRNTAAAPKARIGCSFLLVSALLTCVLLAINGLIVLNLVNAVPDEWRLKPRLSQAFVFLGPLVLLLIEWWVCDVTIDWLRPLGGGSRRREG
jgi:hypothetical protein